MGDEKMACKGSPPGIGLMLALIAAISGGPVWSAVYQVGPGKALDSLARVPWESLKPGDSVLIHARSEPYREKWVLNARGNESARIVVLGIPDNQGRLPIIDGGDAVTPSRLKYWNRNRSVIKIGGSSFPADGMPAYITVEGLEIAGARPPYQFSGSAGREAYASNASAIYIEKGEDIRIVNCVLRDCGNGLFVAAQSTGILVRGCHIRDNGIEGSLYEHNSYTEAMGITFEFNQYGPLRQGCLGNNLKDRSAGCVIRYNWIESGNRQLDLVEAGHSALFDAPGYRSTLVYGNVLVEPEGAGNSQIVHYGGDSDLLGRYRKGTLFFHHNTVVSTRAGNTTLIRLSSAGEKADLRNNIIHSSAAGSRLAILAESGAARMENNWVRTGWRASHSPGDGQVEDAGGNVTGENPGFADMAGQDFSLAAGSACLNTGMVLSGEPWESAAPEFMYVRHRGSIPRPREGLPDMGAFEGLGSGSRVVWKGRKPAESPREAGVLLGRDAAMFASPAVGGSIGGNFFDLRGRSFPGIAPAFSSAGTSRYK